MERLQSRLSRASMRFISLGSERGYKLRLLVCELTQIRGSLCGLLDLASTIETRVAYCSELHLTHAVVSYMLCTRQLRGLGKFVSLFIHAYGWSSPPFGYRHRQMRLAALQQPFSMPRISIAWIA